MAEPPIDPPPAEDQLQQLGQPLRPAQAGNIVANVGSSVAIGLNDLLACTEAELMTVIEAGRQRKGAKR